MSKTRISTMQLTQMLFISNIFFLMMFNMKTTPEIDGSLFMIGRIMAIPLMFLILLPFFWLHKKGKGKWDIVDAGFQVNSIWGKVLGFLYIAYLLFIAVNTTTHLEFFISTAIYPESSGTPFILIMVLICAYACFLGIEPLARMSGIVLVVLIISSVVIFLPLGKDVQVYNLKWLNAFPPQNVAISVYGSLISLSDFVLLLLLNRDTVGNMKKAVPKLLLSCVGFYLVTVFFTTTVTGEYAESMMFPLYGLSSISALSILERMDSIYMMIWVFGGFVRISLFLYTASQTLTKVTKFSQKQAILFHLAIIMGLSLWGSNSLSLLVKSSRFMKTGIVFLLLMVGLPLVTLIVLRIQEGRKRKCEKLV